jgi:DNA sulfur modification protein DndB
MKEQKKIELLGKLITEKNIPTELRLRKQAYNFETIPLKKEEDRIVIREAKEVEGWEFDKDFKNSIKMKVKKPFDKAFEDKVWSLFAGLNFIYLNRGRDFELPYDSNNSQQIDVLAIDNETAIYIECKSSLKVGTKKDYKEILEAWETKKLGVEKSIDALFPNKKLKKKFILATENQIMGATDAARLDKINGIHFDEDMVDYFLDMTKQIGLAARYQLLGALFSGTEIPEMENRIPAVTGMMGGYKYYSFSIEPEKLLKIGFVLHRSKANSNMMPTYQRIIKKSRLKAISEFINDDENPGFFPNSLLINIDSKRDLKWEQANTKVKDAISSVGILHLPKQYRSAYIIDGQHRLYGYSGSKYRHTNSIPVVAFINLERDQQVDMFMKINENQKAIPKTLRETLNADLLWTSKNKIEQIKALCSRLAIGLGEEKDSPFYDYISIGEDKRVITPTSFTIGLRKGNFLGKVNKKEIEKLGSFYKGDIDATYKRLLEFLKLSFDYLKDNLHDEFDKGKNSFLFVNKGITATVMLLSDIVDYVETTNEVKNILKDPIGDVMDVTNKYLDPLIRYIKNIEDSAKDKLMLLKGAGAPVKYWRQFQIEVKKDYNGFSPKGLETFIQNEERALNSNTYEMIKDIEIYLSNDVKIKLVNELGEEWAWKRGAPESIVDDVVKRMAKKNLTKKKSEETDEWDNLNLIYYEKIARKNWTLPPEEGSKKRRPFFDVDYTEPGTENQNKDGNLVWFDKLNKIRNVVSHVSSEHISENDFNFVQKIHNWLIKKTIQNSFQEKNESIKAQ